MNLLRQETATLYALGLLEVGERIAFDAELRRDAQLREQVDALSETTASLAWLAPAAEPSPFLRERVLASVRAARVPSPAAAPADRVAAWLMSWPAAAAFAVLALGGGCLYWKTYDELVIVRADQARVETSLRELQDQLSRQRQQADAVIMELRRQTDVAELKVASLVSLLGDSPEAQAIAFWNPLTQEGVLTVVNLPALEPEKDYQLWLIDPQYDIPVDGGVFRVDPVTGEARVQFRPDRPVTGVEKFAVSLERAGGVPKAEGPMVLIGP